MKPLFFDPDALKKAAAAPGGIGDYPDPVDMFARALPHICDPQHNCQQPLYGACGNGVWCDGESCGSGHSCTLFRCPGF